MSLFIANVIECVPRMGVSIVIPIKGMPHYGIPIIAYLPFTGTESGASPYPLYPAGSTVLCTNVHDDNLHIALIIGCCNAIMDTLTTNYKQLKIYNADGVSASDKSFKSDIQTLCNFLPYNNYRWCRNHANGVDGDAYPGDYDIRDRTCGNGIHVGRFMATLRGSSMAFVDASALTNKVRIVGDCIEFHNMAHEEILDAEYIIRNTAATVSEAFGLRDSSAAITTGTYDLSLTDDKAIPFYRIQHAEGLLINGVEDNILNFPLNESTHLETTEPPILSRVKRDFAGNISTSSVLGIKSIKTPFIPGMQQLGYNKKTQVKESTAFDDLREPFEPAAEAPEAVPEAPSLDDEIMDAAINKIIDNLLTGEYRKSLLKAMANKGFSLASKEASVAEQFKDFKPPAGATTAAHYPPPAYVELETKPTINGTASDEEKTKAKYYSTLSFITQEDDGSICICDGYGSEIRMSQGNIYISPALDLIMRPGRDLSAMVPRHQSYNSQGTCTINSAESIYTRAEKDLKLAGGTSDTGSVTLECLSTKGIESAIPGLVIRSNSNMSVTTANDMYIGRNSHKTQNKASVSEPVSGSIVVDAGQSGVLYEHGGSVTVDANSVVIGALEESSGSAITVNPNHIGVYSSTVLMPASIHTKAPDEDITVTAVRSGKPKKIKMNKAAKSNLTLTGSLVVDSNIIANGASKFNQGVITKGVASTSDLCNAIDPKQIDDIFKPQDINAVPVKNYNTSETDVLTGALHTAYQDYYIVNNSFKFPESYDVSLEVMPGMMWQEYSEASESPGDRWNEIPVVSIDNKKSSCYPGQAIWDSATISKSRYRKVDLKSGYITNTKHNK